MTLTARGHRRTPVCLQIALTVTQVWWTTEVGLAFGRLEEGYENAIKDYNKKQVRGPACRQKLPGDSRRPLLCGRASWGARGGGALSVGPKRPNLGNPPVGSAQR